jgi:hypothetical protein
MIYYCTVWRHCSLSTFDAEEGGRRDMSFIHSWAFGDPSPARELSPASDGDRHNLA